MAAKVLKVDPLHPDAGVIAQAAAILRAGGLVAFPTETVYGLGANALDAQAVAGIFAAKGRPASNPVIVHVEHRAAARRIVRDWPDVAERLAERFWPGPLTLVLPRHDCVPDAVTAGGPTVALRVPAHAVALAMLRACQFPIAAPSANASLELSPTRAEHVLRSLADRIDLVLDAGPTSGGLESTVLDVTTTPPRILRPGLVPHADLEALIGSVAVGLPSTTEATCARSPGQMAKHYAPRTPLERCFESRRRVDELAAQGLRVGWLTHRAEKVSHDVVQVVLPGEVTLYSAELYAALHHLDDAGLDRIVVEMPPGGEEWLAVHDRLMRAAAR